MAAGLQSFYDYSQQLQRVIYANIL